MTSILSSASKIVFILLAVTACVAFFLGRLEAKDFMVLAGMAFAYYFAAKPGDNNQGGGDFAGGVK